MAPMYDRDLWNTTIIHSTRSKYICSGHFEAIVHHRVTVSKVVLPRSRKTFRLHCTHTHTHTIRVSVVDEPTDILTCGVHVLTC